MLIIDNVTKLLREHESDVYFKICSLKKIRSWALSSVQPGLRQEQSIIIGYEKVGIISQNKIEILNPLLLSLIPRGKDLEEYPIIFINLSHHLPRLIEEHLLEIAQFKRLVETKTKLSKNSTKLLTLIGLREIILNVFSSSNIDKSLWRELIEDFEKYIIDLLKMYSFLSYLPVKLRREYKSNFVGDLSFAWEMYFRYFFDQWITNRSPINLPLIEVEYNHEKFRGNYFSRKNSLWTDLIGPDLKFMLTTSQKELIYENWKQWLGEL